MGRGAGLMKGFVNIRKSTTTIINGQPGVVIGGEAFYIKITEGGHYYLENINNRNERKWCYFQD